MATGLTIAVFAVAAFVYLGRDRLPDSFKKLKPLRATSTNVIEASLPDLTPIVAEKPAFPEPALPPPREFAIDELIVAAEAYKELILNNLDSSNPVLEHGQPATVRLGSGMVKSGVVRTVTEKNLILTNDEKTEWVPLVSLDLDNRLAADESYRDKWVTLHSVASARRDLQRERIVMPRFDLETDAGLAMDMADPSALNAAADAILSSTQRVKDVLSAFMYYSASAAQEDPEGLYKFGRLLHCGTGVPQDADKAFNLISLAASRGNASAAKFLEKHNYNEQMIAALADNHHRTMFDERNAQRSRIEELREAVIQRRASGDKSMNLRKSEPRLDEKYAVWADARKVAQLSAGNMNIAEHTE